ncbi:MAG: UDP-N-acetylglucosamine 1-carboxyvinyltransferase, partial [Lachnospiraceae bacterium]|nr:UDP-N-acetylglucosamine 1-carboxyvinyltransferase [Lachnospiraceae bacterium]
VRPMAFFGRSNESIRMEGKKPLGGRIWIQGSKNAALPILAACMLIPGKCVLRGCPDITDIECMCSLLKSTGAEVEQMEHQIEIDTRSVREHRLPEKYVSAMRSSVVLMGAMLGRLGEVHVNYPGGCVIGERPIDLHLYGLEKLGAQIWIEGNHIHAYADELKGAVINLPFPSVGATQNIILAAVTAQGTTVIKNAAKEPEIIELCKFLNRAGASIDYSGTLLKTGRIVIQGVELSRLHGVVYDVISDRIVAGTYLFAALAAGGEITLENIPIRQLDSICDTIRGMGAVVAIDTAQNEMTINACDRDRIVNIPYIETDVYPDFPTDLQSPLLVAACMANGKLTVREKIFSSRFRIVEELQRMGADIAIDGDTAVVTGGKELEGRTVIARELRGGAALIIAGLCASGITTVTDSGYIRRGYQDIVGDFTELGARISYVD